MSYFGGLNSHETLHPDTPENIPVGEKQPVNPAQALAAEPEIILCDKVSSSLVTIAGKVIIDWHR